MRAACLVGPQRFELRRVGIPELPPDGLVLRVEACGICGSDLRRWREGPPAGGEGIVPGHEIAGIVVAAGSQAQGFALGDRLALAPDVHCGKCYYCQRGAFNLCDSLRLVGITPGYPGGFAEQLVLTREILTLGIVHRIPKELTAIEATLAEPLSSVLAAHQRTGTSLEHTVVVLGAGPIGCLHVAVAKARGARVVVSQPSATRRSLVAQFEPEAIIDPTSEDVVSLVRQLTGGRGADIAICANPVASTQTAAIEMVRKGGTVVLFGGLPRATPMTWLDGNRIHYGEIEVVGSFSYHPTMHAQALDMLRRRLVQAELLVTHLFPLEQIGEAFERASAREGLKFVILPTSEGGDI